MVYYLYTENIDEFKQFLCDLLNNDDYYRLNYGNDSVLGDYIEVICDSDITDILCVIICDFLTEYYFQEFIFNKIYDEYNIHDINTAVDILIKFSMFLKSSLVRDDVLYVLNKNNSFHFEYYMLFKKEIIINTINNKINEICDNYFTDSYTNNSFLKSFLNVEFSSDYFDNSNDDS